MKSFGLALAILGCLASGSVLCKVGGQAKASVNVAVVGESNLKSNFIEDLKGAAKDLGLQVSIVPRGDDSLKYTLAIAQETTVGSAAGAVIGMDRTGDVVMSVVRSGRFSGRGALNACAKEIAKKMAILER
jgi:hypothetical protein